MLKAFSIVKINSVYCLKPQIIFNLPSFSKMIYPKIYVNFWFNLVIGINYKTPVPHLLTSI